MISKKELIPHVMKILEVMDIRDPSGAFDTVVFSLATILKSIGIRDLLELIGITSFAPIRRLEKLSGEELSLLERLVRLRMVSLTPSEIVKNQVEVVRLLDPFRRKKLAAYYTRPVGVRLMKYLALRYAETSKGRLVLLDPFMGSGLTLSEVARDLPKTRVEGVLGIEYHVLPALVGYAAIVYSLGGGLEKVCVLVGDSFRIIGERLSPLLRYFPRMGIFPRADMILTNPPFTRWEMLDKEYRGFLIEFLKRSGYDRYVGRRQLGLQVVSLFLIDSLLKDRGLLVSVLPASTFYTIYGEAVKELLRDRYAVDAIIELGSEASFSIDSGFKEIILAARKTREGAETAFITITDESDKNVEAVPEILGKRVVSDSINWVDLSRIPYPWNLNWLSLFGRNPLREHISRIFKHAREKGLLITWGEGLGAGIVRGVEMYGPNFFFIPNRYWEIVEEDPNAVVIERGNGTELEIDRDFLVPALRKPELYTDSITPGVGHYLLSIPPIGEKELPPDIARYIEWGRSSYTAEPSIRAFGRYWYSHVYRQLTTKKPFGRVFLPDKIDPSFKNRGVFACYSDRPLTASKNFYIVTLNDGPKDKALALWFNSSLFIAYFIVAGRKIGERWARFLEEDYLRMPVLNVNILDEQALEGLVKSFDRIAGIKLKPYMLQLCEEPRLEIDIELLSILGIENLSIVLELHSLLRKALNRHNIYPC